MSESWHADEREDYDIPDSFSVFELLSISI